LFHVFYLTLFGEMNMKYLGAVKKQLFLSLAICALMYSGAGAAQLFQITDTWNGFGAGSQNFYLWHDASLPAISMGSVVGTNTSWVVGNAQNPGLVDLTSALLSHQSIYMTLLNDSSGPRTYASYPSTIGMNISGYKVDIDQLSGPSRLQVVFSVLGSPAGSTVPEPSCLVSMLLVPLLGRRRGHA
jgi:hypothetical protein